MLNKLHWIDGGKLTQFILQCQVSSVACGVLRSIDKNRTLNLVGWLIGLETW
jgi:prenyltransferase beta subunit